jgi:hypothetical protein
VQFNPLALFTDDQPDSALPKGYGNFMEVSGKLQPTPKGVSAKKNVVEQTLWAASSAATAAARSS